MAAIDRRNQRKMVALILGGGQGKRLFPLTMYRSKPAVPIGGKYRLIDIPISNCLHSNIKDIYVLTQFNSESLNNHINNTYRFDYFSRAFVRILAAEQTLDNINWFQGTADAVRKNITHLNLQGDEDVLILSGDHLYNMDYRDFAGFHRKMGADFSVSVLPIRESEVREFGILELENSCKISRFKEKPRTKTDLKGLQYKGARCALGGRSSPGAHYLASMGVYIFNAKALKKALDNTDADFGREVIPHSIKTLRGYGYIFHGYWKDVGTIRSFYDVNMEMAASRPHFSFFYEGAVFTRPRFLPSARVFRSRLRHCIVSEGCVINDAEVRNSIIGLRMIIGKNCRITRTVLMGADYFERDIAGEPIKLGIGDGTSIDKAIVDKNARIGRNCVIRNIKGLKNYDGPNYYIRDGIIIIPKNAVIKDGTRI